MSSGSAFLGPKVMEIMQKQMKIRRFPFPHFMMILNAFQNMMLLQKNEKVIISLKVVQQVKIYEQMDDLKRWKS